MNQQLLPVPSTGQQKNTEINLSEGYLNELLDNRTRAFELIESIANQLAELDSLITQRCPITDDEKPVSLVKEVKDKILGNYETYFIKDTFLTRIRPSIDKYFWELAYDRSRLDALITRQESKENRALFRSAECPEFESVPVFTLYTEKLQDIYSTFAGTVVNVFSKLQRGFATNDGIRFGKKIILKEVYQPNSWSQQYSSTSADLFTDLWRVCMFVDNKDPLDVHDATLLIYTAFKEQQDEAQIETEYLTICKCQNGNLHIQFKSQDLVNKLNKFIEHAHSETLGHRTAKRPHGL